MQTQQTFYVIKKGNLFAKPHLRSVSFTTIPHLFLSIADAQQVIDRYEEECGFNNQFSDLVWVIPATITIAEKPVAYNYGLI